ncbi:NADH:ubiquinone oxidoreductase subunit NDUFA12 [Vannielia sp.]|uniref:NADH:ubiquinone oxidoreductase subunit NDUFA12 n=1 Tax=Vannielia sp. TaxID=2813045 RepID=UPI00262BA9B8|nr:NADH:ubiquinone oxidoreductase subunit NDUFA12 [Vannielia sp.]MDF1871659.1 NADH:ubiquinone oxidoreductase subunit NDUFA12 [Vannielia sp.]
MGIKNFILRLFTWWHGSTLGTQYFTARKGKKVGEDEAGNVFYRNADDSRRWVIFNGEVEASKISPDWHGWLHHTYADSPADRPLTHKPWEKPHEENHTGTALAYAPAGSIRRAQPARRTDYEAWSPE